jgi:hypothetical protein
LSSAAPDKDFAECKVAFAGCFRHPAKRLNPVVSLVWSVICGAPTVEMTTSAALTALRLLAFFILYIHTLKGIFHPGHQDSLLYTTFFCTHHPLYLILYINYQQWDLHVYK